MNYDYYINQYKNLINVINSAISQINKGNEKLNHIPDALKAGILVNNEPLEEDVFSSSLANDNDSINYLRSAISSCSNSIATLERKKREEEARKKREEERKKQST